jgi:hypothetical protein
VRSSLVHRDGEEVGARTHNLVDELVEAVGVAAERRQSDVERREQRGDVRRRDRKLGLRDWPPLLEPLVAHLLEPLDVQHAVADLDARFPPA